MTIKSIKLGDLTYSINEEDKTVSVIKIEKDSNSYSIPRIINHESQEYAITSISENAIEEVYDIEFAKDSQIQTIEAKAFYNSLISSLTIPASVIDLKYGCFYGAIRLRKIKVDPKNPRYLSINDQILIGKSELQQNKYDVLFYCSSDIKTLKIPYFIEIIAPYAFYNCNKIQSIEFSKDSKFEINSSDTFSNNFIKNLFHFDKKINEPQLKIIEKDAFYFSSIKSLALPSSLIDLKEGWDHCTFQLNQVKVKENSKRYLTIDDKYIIGKSNIEQENYDVFVFCNRDVKSLKIPDSIEIIAENAFCRCQIEKIEISNDSKLRIIKEFSFCSSSIEQIFIPSNVTKICKSAFVNCRKLRQIEFDKNSKLRIIGNEAFRGSKIQNVFIPNEVTRICKLAFGDCDELKQIEFSSNSKLETIEKDAFYKTAIETLFIPNNVKYLEDDWCRGLLNINKIIVSENNQFYSSINDNKLLIGKSNFDEENFDVLFLCVRNIEAITIPSFI